MTNHYDTLGVPHDASDEAIKSAYRREARKHHPDKGGDSKAMTRVNVAYETLSDAKRREQYDRTGEDKPQDPASLAAAHIANLICECIERTQGDGDIVGQVKVILGNLIAQTKKSAADGEAVVRVCEKALKRLKYKGKGKDLALLVIEDKVATVKQKLAYVHSQTEVFKLAHAMLADYEYEFQLAEPVSGPYGNGAESLREDVLQGALRQGYESL